MPIVNRYAQAEPDKPDKTRISPKERQALEHELQTDAGELQADTDERATELEKAPPKEIRPGAIWRKRGEYAQEEDANPRWEFTCPSCIRNKRHLHLGQYYLTIGQVLHIVNSPHHEESQLRLKKILTLDFLRDFWDLCEKLAGTTLDWDQIWREFKARRPSQRMDDSRLYYLDYLVVKEGTWEHTLIEMDAVADYSPEDFAEGTRTPEEVARYRQRNR